MDVSDKENQHYLTSWAWLLLTSIRFLVYYQVLSPAVRTASFFLAGSHTSEQLLACWEQYFCEPWCIIFCINCFKMFLCVDPQIELLPLVWSCGSLVFNGLMIYRTNFHGLCWFTLPPSEPEDANFSTLSQHHATVASSENAKWEPEGFDLHFSNE